MVMTSSFYVLATLRHDGEEECSLFDQKISNMYCAKFYGIHYLCSVGGVDYLSNIRKT